MNVPYFWVIVHGGTLFDNKMGHTHSPYNIGYLDDSENQKIDSRGASKCPELGGDFGVEKWIIRFGSVFLIS